MQPAIKTTCRICAPQHTVDQVHTDLFASVLGGQHSRSCAGAGWRWLWSAGSLLPRRRAGGAERPKVQPTAGDSGFHRGRVGPGELGEARCSECALSAGVAVASTTASPHSRPSASSATARGKWTRTHLKDVPRESHVRGILETTELAQTASPREPNNWCMSGIGMEQNMDGHRTSNTTTS